MTNQNNPQLGEQRSYVQSRVTVISCHADLGTNLGPLSLSVETPVTALIVTVSNQERGLLEQLMKGPVETASPVHLAALVSRLRKKGLPINTVRVPYLGLGNRRRADYYELSSSQKILRLDIALS